MAKIAFVDHAAEISDDDDDFVDLDAPMLNPFDQLEILSIMSRGREAAERMQHQNAQHAKGDMGDGLKNSREEVKLGYEHAYTQPVSHFTYQLGKVLDIGMPRTRLAAVPEERKHICNVCSKSYKKKNSLVSHMRKHVLSHQRHFLDGREAVCLHSVWQTIYGEEQSEDPPANSLGTKTIQMSVLRKLVHDKGTPGGAQASAHGRKAVHVQGVWEELQKKHHTQDPPASSHQGKALSLLLLRQKLHRVREPEDPSQNSRSRH